MGILAVVDPVTQAIVIFVVSIFMALAGGG